MIFSEEKKVFVVAIIFLFVSQIIEKKKRERERE